MPLVTEITRNGEIHKPEGGWTEYVLCAMYTAALKESDPDLEFQAGGTLGEIPDGEVIDFIWSNPIYLLDSEQFNAPLVKRGEQTLLQTHVFDNGEQCVTFLPGDRLRAWRE